MTAGRRNALESRATAPRSWPLQRQSLARPCVARARRRLVPHGGVWQWRRRSAGPALRSRAVRWSCSVSLCAGDGCASPRTVGRRCIRARHPLAIATRSDVPHGQGRVACCMARGVALLCGAWHSAGNVTRCTVWAMCCFVWSRISVARATGRGALHGPGIARCRRASALYGQRGVRLRGVTDVLR